MRRGHQGASGGWRDGPRHFRGRGGPPMHYRGSRGFGSQNVPRYPPGPRFPGPPFGARPPPLFPDNASPGRGRYGPRNIFPHLQRMRHQTNEPGKPYSDAKYYNEQMADDSYEHMPSATYSRPSSWAEPQVFYEDQTAPYDEDPKSAPHRKPAGYAGHRPPASDHYGSNPAASNDNSDTFSRSVDDTVDIVRKRLISRGETQTSSDDAPSTANNIESKQDKSKYESPARQGSVAKKKQKPRNVQANCDQIKSKIVHQLFKMDKDRIHKLMDNPNSSSKFEYAISNLITESQKSYNRHLRSMAEKSLCGTSTEFVNNDNNTIYEDTFMKQMQCILDPQDTVLLEDLKPLVLAELSKVLQLDNLDQGQGFEDQPAYPAREQAFYEDDLPVPEIFSNEYPYNAFKPATDQVCAPPPHAPPPHVPPPHVPPPHAPQTSKQSFETYVEKDLDDKPLFERRHTRASSNSIRNKDHNQQTSDQHFQENIYHKNQNKKQTSDQHFQEEIYYRNKNETSDQKFLEDIYHKNKTIDKSFQAKHTPSADLVNSREEPLWGRRMSNREEPVWGSKTTNIEAGVKVTKSPFSEDRLMKARGKRSPIPEDRLMKAKGKRSPIPEDRLMKTKGKRSPIPEEKFVNSEVTVTENKLMDNNIPITHKSPIPEDRFMGNKNPIPEEKSMASNSPLPDNIFMGCKSPVSDRFGENTSPVPPVFDVNAGDLSDEDEAFAELDRQYHVAVDRNLGFDLDSPPDEFTQNLAKSPVPSVSSPKSKSPERPPITIKPPSKPTQALDNDINNQLLDLAKSPLKLVPSNPIRVKDLEQTLSETQLKLEVKSPSSLSDQTQSNSSEKSNPRDNVTVKQELTSAQDSLVPDKTNPWISRKRSIDLKPSHRKEKRKKIEILPESKILNKNIIINVNDCPGKVSEKCDAPKSVFNLFFAKEKSGKDATRDVKKIDSSDKGHDKHVKRKDIKDKELSKKIREKESDDQKNLYSNINQSSQSPQPLGTNNNTTSKEENKAKLTTFDMFEHCNKKTTIIRLNDPQKKTPVTIMDNVKLGIGRKLTKRHVGTQVVRKICSKETQTPASKSCNCKDKKRSAVSVQTEPVSFKTASKIIDPFERMKEIDIEIQVLLQEKFMLYSSMEAKEPCPNTMQSLGMTVLTEDSKPEDVPDLEDAIVDEFANIPVEELEQIALESVSTMPLTPSKKKKKKSESKQEKSPMKSPVSTRNKKKSTTPNISLIEQIITDDRPLEDIISLDELEVKPSKKKYSKKTPKKSQIPKTPKAQNYKKGSILRRMLDAIEYDIKDCCVVLKREDLSKYMTKEQKEQKQKTTKDKSAKKKKTGDKSSVNDKDKVVGDQSSVNDKGKIVGDQSSVNDKEKVVGDQSSVNDKEKVVVDHSSVNDKEKVVGDQSSVKDKETAAEKPESQEQTEDIAVIEETVVNDIQFDMLDVSEDIVIGDSCEVKTTDEKVSPSNTCEDIILDNSQSSVEDAVVPATGVVESECKLFDFSADEALKRDTITVSGNADAVLAIECIDNNFIAACLNGNVYYFSGEGQLLSTLRGSNLAVTCLCIVREKHGITVYTGSLDSRIRYFDLETGLEKGPEGNVLSPIQTMDRAWDTIFVGTRTGFVLQFECKNNMLIPVSTVKFSEQSILALRAMKEGPRKVLLVAARSEPVTIKDAQTGLLLRTLEGPKMTVYTLLFEDGKVYCGTSNHQIHVFDYVSGGHVGVHEGGKGAVCLRAAGGLVFAGCYDGCVYVYREGQPRPLAQLRGPGLMLLSLAVIGSKIIAGYKDRSLYIWKMPEAILSEMIL